MKDLETKKKFVELRANGLSYDRISQEIDVSKPTLIGWGKEFEKDILEIKESVIQELRLKYQMNKDLRILALSGQAMAILNELQSRDLNEVKTEKLMGLLIRTLKAADNMDHVNVDEKDTDEFDKLMQEISKY
mgnify:CR=1 FL=1